MSGVASPTFVRVQSRPGSLLPRIGSVNGTAGPVCMVLLVVSTDSPLSKLQSIVALDGPLRQPICIFEPGHLDLDDWQPTVIMSGSHSTCRRIIQSALRHRPMKSEGAHEIRRQSAELHARRGDHAAVGTPAHRRPTRPSRPTRRAAGLLDGVLTRALPPPDWP